jgi:hypothetical protein
MRHVVNLNGDTRETLMKQMVDCSNALGEALSVLAQNGPHGRNYQTACTTAFADDRSDHQALCIALQQAQVKYSEAAEALYLDDPNGGETVSNYDAQGSYIGHVKNENGWTP